MQAAKNGLNPNMPNGGPFAPIGVPKKLEQFAKRKRPQIAVHLSARRRPKRVAAFRAIAHIRALSGMEKKLKIGNAPNAHDVALEGATSWPSTAMSTAHIRVLSEVEL